MNSSPIKKTKDPHEDLDFTWSFDSLLEDDESIVSHEFHDVPDVIELHDESAGERAVVAWVSPGGTVGSSYDVSCKVTTDSTPPRIFDRTIRFVMVAK